MTRAWVTPALVLVVATLPAAVSAGALEECYQRTTARPEVTPCLNAAKKAATDAMREQFLAVRQSLEDLEKVTGRGGKVAALKQSQRDFERYLQSHCQVVLQSFDSGTGAGQAQLACEVDLLRDRAAALKALAPDRDLTKK
jgi:uncharacterized protein YecT (DUF1311 family)